MYFQLIHHTFQHLALCTLFTEVIGFGLTRIAGKSV